MVQKRKKRLVRLVFRRRVVAKAQHHRADRVALIILANGIKRLADIAGVDGCPLFSREDFKLTEHKRLAGVDQRALRLAATARLGVDATVLYRKDAEYAVALAIVCIPRYDSFRADDRHRLIPPDRCVYSYPSSCSMPGRLRQSSLILTHSCRFTGQPSIHSMSFRDSCPMRLSMEPPLPMMMPLWDSRSQ